MRGWIAAIAVFLLFAPPVAAAPTCQGREGQTMRCGAPGAMPLGWTAPEADRRIASADQHEVWLAAGIILALFALIALLPDFDGSQPTDWEPDERERR